MIRMGILSVRQLVLAGLTVTEENIAQKHRIISILESSRQEMYELTKKEFIRNNGLQNGDTIKRGDVYTNFYKKTAKNDRLTAGNKLEQYERAYRQAFIEAAKKDRPQWGRLENRSRRGHWTASQESPLKVHLQNREAVL